MDRLATVFRRVLAENGLSGNSSGLHGWRCEYPDRYGECSCLEELINELVGAAMSDQVVGISEGLELLLQETRHVVQFDEHGWIVAHPLRERLNLDNLFKCKVRPWAYEWPGFGRFYLNDDGSVGEPYPD